MKKQFLGMIVMLLFAAGIAGAQPYMHPNCPNYGSNGWGPNPEVQNYFNANILPVMKTHREALDASISQADQARLDEIRTQMNDLRDQQWAHREQMRQSGERPTVEQRREMRAVRGQMLDLMDEVSVMAENYATAIDNQLDAVRDQIPGWQEDLRELCPGNPNCPYGNGNGPRHGRKGRGAGMGRGWGSGHGGHGMGYGGPGFGMGPMHRIMTPEGFLLWNPEQPWPNNPAGQQGNTGGLRIDLFPNPATGSVQVSLKLDKDSKIEINLVDNEGNTLKTFDKNASEGLFSQVIDISELKTGIYFVKVKTDNSKGVQRLIVQ